MSYDITVERSFSRASLVSLREGVHEFWLYTEKNGFVTGTKLRTTNKFFVAATKNFAAATKRLVDRTKHFVVTKYFCYPYFNKWFCWYKKNLLFRVISKQLLCFICEQWINEQSWVNFFTKKSIPLHREVNWVWTYEQLTQVSIEELAPRTTTMNQISFHSITTEIEIKERLKLTQLGKATMSTTGARGRLRIMVEKEKFLSGVSTVTSALWGLPPPFSVFAVVHTSEFARRGLHTSGTGTFLTIGNHPFIPNSVWCDRKDMGTEVKWFSRKKSIARSSARIAAKSRLSLFGPPRVLIFNHTLIKKCFPLSIVLIGQFYSHAYVY